MPIVFVHGVRVRSDGAFKEVEPLLRKHVAPRLNADRPEDVPIRYAYWGKHGVTWAWNMASRPKSLLGMGGAAVSPLALAGAAEAPESLAASAPAGGAGGIVAGGGVLAMGGAASADGPAVTGLLELGEEALADTVIAYLEAARNADASDASAAAAASDPPIDGYTVIAAAEAAADPAVRAALAQLPNDADRLEILTLETLSRARTARQDVTGMGVFGGLAERVKEGFSRAVSAPGFVLSRGLGELRPAIHGFVADFLGDVLVYMEGRGVPGSPGPIPKVLLDALHAARAAAPPGEPLVVLTHSMGGQVAYDVFTRFAPADPRLADLDVAFWASAGSQVGFFEEAKLFLASDDAVKADAREGAPANVRAWWNVWDPNDLVSFTAAKIFEGRGGRRFQDEAYLTGAGLALAHVSYFGRPSFWRRLGEQLDAAGLTAR